MMSAETKKRPNIIILNPDEMRADALGHLGNRGSHTPRIDELARTDAVSFSNAFCQNPENCRYVYCEGGRNPGECKNIIASADKDLILRLALNGQML